MNGEVNTMAILDEIRQERGYQRTKYGTDFDDANTMQDWAAFIMSYLASGRPPREALLKVATLAVAAIEAIDRKENS